MHLAYESPDLRGLCEQEDLAKRQWGFGVARKLFNRIADIHVATTTMELIAGSPKIIGQGVEQQLVIRLEKDLCLFLVPLPIPPPLNKDGQIAWGKISRLKALKIEAHHD